MTEPMRMRPIVPPLRGPSPWDATPLPEPLPPPEPGSFFDRAPDAWKNHLRREAWARTPEGQAHLRAEEERRQAERRESDARSRRYQLTGRCAAREIPAEVGVRAIVFDDAPHETDALRLYRTALVWRTSNSRQDVGTAGLVRVVAGPPGTGKSCALAWVVARHRDDALFATAAKIAATPRNGWSANEEAWQRWLSVDLLAIDEAGCEKGDGSAVAFILAERYNAGLATLVACNLAIRDFHARYPDERLADRLINGQGHAGAPSGLRWFETVAGKSLRNPGERARLASAEGE
jgi:hypothetical protein